MTINKTGIGVLLSAVILLTGCSKNPLKKSIDEKLSFNESEYHLAFKNRFTGQILSELIKDSSFQYLDTLKEFYAGRNFKPLFIKSFDSEDLVNSLLVTFEKAEEHGLDPEQYHFSIIATEFYNAVNDTINNPHKYVQLANTELFIADAVLKYSYHLRYGVVNPSSIFIETYYIPLPDSAKIDLFEPLKQQNIIEYLDKIQPNSEKYTRLQTALKRFNSYKEFEWKLLPVSDKKLNPGNRDSILVPIVKRLITLGFIDTSRIRLSDYSVYDSLLQEPVRRFQKLYGLNDDGVIGRSTIEKLNITPDEYVRKIKISLERFRWLNYSDTSSYILVNIPDFRLYLIENRKEVFDMKVCLGRKRPPNFEKRYEIFKKSKRLADRPDDWETPCLYGQISELILNPKWNVPESIIREEILAGIKRDSSYLSKKNFKVFKGGVEITHAEVNLDEFALDRIPYRIIQDAGYWNALGKIKFMFKNPFGVYLHDTPNKRPFTYSNRAVSHGCIRVEKPLQLAEYILANHSKWNIDFLKIEIGQNPDNKARVAEFRQVRAALRKDLKVNDPTEIKLERTIPLFIDYYTAWVDDNGDINFRDDIYRQDKILERYLFREKI